MAGAIWVVMQHRGGELHRGAREALVAGQRLAELSDGAQVEAIFLGSNVSDLARDLASRVDLGRVLVADDPALDEYTPGAYAGALAAAARERAPQYVLFLHTYQSMEYFPRVAQRLDGAIVPDVSSFRAHEGAIVWRRGVLGGKLVADVRARRDKTVLASIQAGAYPLDGLRSGSTAVEPLDLGGAGLAKDREILSVEHAGEEEVDLSRAGMIVAAGRGVGGKDKMGVVEELAAALGAEIGASRPVIDNDWLPRDRQIGSSGQTVAPKLYVAVGISGAIQHLVGMKGSKVVVAINKDPNAPIFSVADYGIVGDLHEILPALTAAVKAAKG